MSFISTIFLKKKSKIEEKGREARGRQQEKWTDTQEKQKVGPILLVLHKEESLKAAMFLQDKFLKLATFFV